jgi:Chlorophyllase enzyme
MLRFSPLRPGQSARRASRWTLLLGFAFAAACSGSDEPKQDQSSNPSVTLNTCEGGSRDACDKFITPEGTELTLGDYGAVMEPNVGAGYENTVNTLVDNYLACSIFVAAFQADAAQSERLLNIMDLNLALYTIYRPAKWKEGEKYPVVTWGNGTCAQPEGYGALLRYVASQGYVVIAANSRYVGSGNEQRRGLDFIFDANDDPKSPYYKKLDPDRVAAMGHSQGGMGTVAAAADPRIKAVILFNGGSTAQKPFLAISGDRDIFATGADQLAGPVNAAPKAAFLFYHMIPGTGALDGHLTLMLEPERVTGATVAWLDFMLDGDQEAKGWFAGSSCKLCGKDAEYEFGQNGLD